MKANACRSRFMVFSFPRTSMTSKSPGLAVFPVGAWRTGGAICFIFIRVCSSKAWNAAHQVVVGRPHHFGQIGHQISRYRGRLAG